MHEMSLCEGIRSVLEAQAAAHNVARITRVRLEIHGTTHAQAVCRNVFGVLPGQDAALAQLTASEDYRKRVFSGGLRVQGGWQKLLEMEGVPQLIRREIEHVKAGRKGHMILKCNSLVDDELIRELYQARAAVESQAARILAALLVDAESTFVWGRLADGTHLEMNACSGNSTPATMLKLLICRHYRL